MERNRLRAPESSGAVLAAPGLDQVETLLASNRTMLESWHYDFQGRPATWLRGMTRDHVLSAARSYTAEIGAQTDGQPSAQAQPDAADHQSAISSGPQHSTFDPRPSPPLLLTGHQPELFHPGVWIKNFASHQLALRHGGVSLHLIVDNDTVKKTTVRAPTGSLAQPSVVHIPFDRWRGEIPFEEYEVDDESLFKSFGQRLESALEPLGIEPLSRSFWPIAIESASQTKRLAGRITAARHRQEASWGCHNLELPVSRLCQTEGFHWFACHVLAQLSRFRNVYNEALDEYRRRNRIRSRNHPVPSLHKDGEWLEAPFWVWTTDRPRRRQLFALQQGCNLVLSDRDQWTATLPLAPDREACCAVEVLAELGRQGIKIRTRALTTTIFTRLCLADLFIHGLGGARYDELADAIIRRFFGLGPPRFLTLTGTLHLPLPRRDATIEKARQLDRLLRDLTYNPDRHLNAPGNLNSLVTFLVEEKRRAILEETSTRAESRRRFEHIRSLNDQLAPFVDCLRTETTAQLGTLQADLAANAIFQNREWAFCVYPESTLRNFVNCIRPLSATADLL